MRNRVQRRNPIPAVLLVLAMAACGVSSSDAVPANDKLPTGASTSTTPRSTAARENANPARTVILHVTGMMKSRSGAT